DRRDGGIGDAVQKAAASVFLRADLGHPGARSRVAPDDRARQRRRPEPGEHAVRLPIPPALPVRREHLPPAGAAAQGARPRAPRRVSLPRRRVDRIARGFLSMTAPVRFGLIGYGLWGRLHAEAIKKAPDALLVSIACASRETAAAAERALPGVPVYLDYRALLARPDIDAVDVVVPNHLHAEIGAASLAAATGEPVCETNACNHGGRGASL